MLLIFALILGIWSIVDYKQNYDNTQDDASRAMTDLSLSIARHTDALELESLMVDNQARRLHRQAEDFVAVAKARAKLREDVQPDTDKDQLDIARDGEHQKFDGIIGIVTVFALMVVSSGFRKAVNLTHRANDFGL